MKRNPLKWFPSRSYTVAKISLRKVDWWAERNRQHVPYFDTWREAHADMLNAAKRRFRKAESEFARAKRHLARVEALTEPAAIAAEQGEVPHG